MFFLSFKSLRAVVMYYKEIRRNFIVRDMDYPWPFCLTYSKAIC